ncbi:unnamed protein product [Leptidea sinapis]|uniref:Uncharacterized protein n=1 Tax=Leptidea sinapis TaxID=189913 RepID=A0A5E4QYJ8_9NEOP|nr:unnamed protein product [Leptidea sinapis]
MHKGRKCMTAIYGHNPRPPGTPLTTVITRYIGPREHRKRFHPSLFLSRIRFLNRYWACLYASQSSGARVFLALLNSFLTLPRSLSSSGPHHADLLLKMDFVETLQRLQLCLDTRIVGPPPRRRQRFFIPLHRPPRRFSSLAVSVHILSFARKVCEPGLQRFGGDASMDYAWWINCRAHCGWVLSEVGGILVATAYENFKSPKDRLAKQSYLQTKLETLEEQWKVITENHKLSELSDATIESKYFKDNVYEDIEETYSETKQVIDQVSCITASLNFLEQKYEATVTDLCEKTKLINQLQTDNVNLTTVIPFPNRMKTPP